MQPGQLSQCSDPLMEIFQKSRCNFRPGSARKVTWSRFRIGDPQISGRGIEKLVVTTTWGRGLLHPKFRPCPEIPAVLPQGTYTVKVKCTLVQALRLCTGRTAHRGSRGIALLFHDHGTGKGVRGQRHAPAAFYPWDRPGTHCTGGWVGPRAGLDRCRKYGPHRDSIRGPSSP